MKHALAFAIGLVAGLIGLAPARLLLPSPPLSGAVTGSLWRADLGNARLGQLALGDLHLGLEPAALVTGRLQWQVTGALAGLLWRSPGGAGASGLNGALGAAPLPGLPVAMISLADAGATLDDKGRCQAASGQVRITLTQPLAGQRQLVGAPRCEGGALQLPLASGDGRLRLDLAASGQGWTARLTVSGASLGEAVALRAAGFTPRGDALVREETSPW